MKIKIMLLLILTTMILLSACTSTGDVVRKDAIVIGAVAPLSGSASSYGFPAGRAIQLAVNEINAQGGINGKQIQLILEDGKCDAATSTLATKKLIEINNVDVLLAGHCSTESMAVEPLANENKIIQLATMTSTPDYSFAGEYSFRNWPTGDYFVGKLGERAYEDGSRKITSLYEQKDHPQATAESFKKQFEKKGGKIVDELSYPADEKDFSSYLLKIQKEDVDSIYFASQGEEQAIDFYKKMYELGLFDKFKNIYVNNAAISKHIQELTRLLNKHIITSDVYVDENNPQTRKFLEAYKARYSTYPQTNNYYVASSYDGVYLIKDAIEYCKEVNSTCIKDYFNELRNWTGASGTIEGFDKYGDINTSVGIHYFTSTGKEIWEII